MNVTLKPKRKPIIVIAAFITCTFFISCNSNIKSTGEVEPSTSSCDNFQANPSYIYTNKVKTLLTGLAPTDDELKSVSDSKENLKKHIRSWLKTKEADEKLLSFFDTAFQQGANINELKSIIGNVLSSRFHTNANAGNLLIQNFMESFSNTALDNYKADKPFTDLMNTSSYKMTTAMAMQMGYNEYFHHNDNGQRLYQPAKVLPNLQFVRNQTIPLSESLDDTHPNFWKFSIDAHTNWWPACISGDETTFIANKGLQYRWAWEFLLGRINLKRFTQIDGCSSGNTTRASFRPPLEVDYFNDWKTVQIEQTPTDKDFMGFFDVYTQLQSNNTLQFRTPRIGYYSTSAFLNKWLTNDANSSRVTANQAIIVGLGKAFESNENSNLTPAEADQMDINHAAPGTSCFSCHQSLDPMRQIFRSNLTVFNSVQQDETEITKDSYFAFGGTQAPIPSLSDFGALIAQNSNFAKSWTQKLCSYANSKPCPENSETFKEVSNAFKDSNFNFRTLLEELFSSSLITGATCIPEGTGDHASTSRKIHFCSNLSNRLDIHDICALKIDGNAAWSNFQKSIRTLANGLPSDSFSRGEKESTTISDPGIMIRNLKEKICSKTSSQVVGTGKKFDPKNSTQAIHKLVADFVGLPESDPRHEPMKNILERHYEQSRAHGETDQVSMQSVFIASCMSPSIIGIGL